MKIKWYHKLFTFRFYFTLFSINPAILAFDIFSFSINFSYLFYFNIALLHEHRGGLRFIFDILLFNKFFYAFDTARRETNYWLLKKKGF